jgi:hypothetical protein
MMRVLADAPGGLELHLGVSVRGAGARTRDSRRQLTRQLYHSCRQAAHVDLLWMPAHAPARAAYVLACRRWRCRCRPCLRLPHACVPGVVVLCAVWCVLCAVCCARADVHADHHVPGRRRAAGQVDAALPQPAGVCVCVCARARAWGMMHPTPHSNATHLHTTRPPHTHTRPVRSLAPMHRRSWATARLCAAWRPQPPMTHRRRCACVLCVCVCVCLCLCCACARACVCEARARWGASCMQQDGGRARARCHGSAHGVTRAGMCDRLRGQAPPWHVRAAGCCRGAARAASCCCNLLQAHPMRAHPARTHMPPLHATCRTRFTRHTCHTHSSRSRPAGVHPALADAHQHKVVAGRHGQDRHARCRDGAPHPEGQGPRAARVHRAGGCVCAPRVVSLGSRACSCTAC